MFKKETEWPALTPARPFVRALRIRRDFTCEGVRFREGQLVSPDSEFVQRILAEHPMYFESGAMPKTGD